MKKLFTILSFAFLFCFIVINTSYASTVDVPEGFDDILASNDYNHYFYLSNLGVGFKQLVLFYDSGDYMTTENASFNVVRNSVDGSTVISLLTPSGNKKTFSYMNYIYKDGTWNRPSATSSLTYTTTFNSTINLELSTFDIYNDDGTIFFQAPPTELYQMIQKVTAEEMRTQQKNLDGTMTILTLCGVGLIALLMVFPLFGKVLRIFRL